MSRMIADHSSFGLGASFKNTSDKDSASDEEAVDEKSQVLRAAMSHVSRLGWTESALVQGAKDAGLSPAIVGSFPRKDAALVEFFMDECNRHLEDEVEAREKELSSMLLAERIAQLVRLRLQMQIPFLSKWPQALSIQAHPMNAATALKQRAVLMDDIWHAVGDRSTDMDWYTKRALLGGVYAATELYMLTDYSPGHRDSWAFLERRIKDAIDCRKTAQEASQLAQAVGMGLSNSLSSLFSRGSQM
uniref:Ubiquinone biosynthesis protein n=1 Tax=Physcomitrium patens TaxID=3218 RepID=A0A7I4FII4_PHYPA|nr:ubiquinone biosynthesis protein COQ9-A, mitochondrial-like isoform X2 [Physcomitrium patens]|eukprot:XP_024366742.1 ubiquinone biosynthesis protein COQ9-A, mitochondrial-like isoform X2 [Physcomitrella patens]